VRSEEQRGRSIPARDHTTTIDRSPRRMTVTGEGQAAEGGRRRVDRRSSPPDRLLFTPEEAAAVLSVSRTKVFELIGTGQLRSGRIGASRRIPARELERFVQELIEPVSNANDWPARATVGFASW
jgi:excisionase family DNA binding protein